MELLVANLAGRPRREDWNGRRYLVAPLTLLVPGVLNGSKGPLLYPPDEVRKSPEDWNHIPIVVNHPMKNGKPVSARSPSILAECGVGFVFHAHTGGKEGALKAEGWFDIEHTRRVNKKVLDWMESGKPIELSTGLFVEDVPAPEGSIYNGARGKRKYVAVARNYKPDHLAVLPDQKGACSIDDGCGVLVNWDGPPAFHGLVLLANAYNPKQPRVPAGKTGGGRFTSVKAAGAAVEKAKSRVAKAQSVQEKAKSGMAKARLTLEKAKAALKVEKDGLVVAKRGLTEAKSREKAKSAAAKGAIRKVSAKEPVDVKKHVSYGKALLAEGMVYKKVKKPGEPPVAIPTMPDNVYHQKVNDHVGDLTKTLNKAQSIELLKGYGFTVSSSTTKKKALENVKSYLIRNRASFYRGLE